MAKRIVGGTLLCFFMFFPTSPTPCTCIVESCVRGEHEESSCLVPPPDHVLAHDGLHDGVEAALRRVEVTRHLGPLHLHGEGGGVGGQPHVVLETVGGRAAVTGFLAKY